MTEHRQALYRESTSVLIRIFAGVLGAAGLGLLGGGIYLLFLGGSAYYAIVGALFLVSGWLCWQGKISGVRLFLLVFVGTIIWAIWEVGFSFWPLVPRLVGPLVLAAVALMLVPKFPQCGGRPANATPYFSAGIVLLVAFFGYLAAMFYPHGVIQNDVKITYGNVSEATQAAGNNWVAWGKTGHGTRYAEIDQINLKNINDLEVAWTAHSGVIANQDDFMQDQTAPLYVDGTLYHCAPNAQITALNGSTGAIKWKFDPKAKSPDWKRCRSIAYFDPGAGDSCGPRIVETTFDARLIAVKASDGKPCETFGENGTVDLWLGMGDADPDFLTNSSGPVIAKGKIILGGRVTDNVTEGEPSGVIRAYDAKTGQIAWVWDMGQPALKGLPGPGQHYTKGTPNAWSLLSFDEKLGLVYVPLGNATPDIYGGQRRKFDDEYNSSVVALNIDNGDVVWKFQTTHHDLWDYDLPSQPILADISDGKGGTVPSLIQLTKRSQIFVLDRRTGKPIKRVEEKTVPKSDGTIQREYYSETQPYSVEMPAIGAEALTEKRMWGATLFDQLACRILFHKYRFHGDFTTPSTQWSIVWPGPQGGPNYGSAAVDEKRGILVMAELRFPLVQRLVKRGEEEKGLKYTGENGYFFPMSGTPYIMERKGFMSPLMIPCLEPNWGAYSGIDLASGKLIWQQPAGTSQDLAIGTFKPGIAFNVGMPPLGGAAVTKSGIAFAGGYQDYYLRAYETETGNEIWKSRLPTGTQTFPITYVGEDGRQYVVISASGARHNPSDWSDLIIAYALPKK